MVRCEQWLLTDAGLLAAPGLRMTIPHSGAHCRVWCMLYLHVHKATAVAAHDTDLCGIVLLGSCCVFLMRCARFVCGVQSACLGIIVWKLNQLLQWPH